MERGYDTESRSLAVLEAVAAREERAPSALPPLHRAIDPDALDALFAPRIDDTARPGGRVTFPYAGYTVVITADGQVELCD